MPSSVRCGARPSVAACLPKCLLDRLRAALADRPLRACASADALVRSAESYATALVVLDPVLCPPAEVLSPMLDDAFGPCVPTALYTHVSPTSIRLCFAWARAGVPQLLLAGQDDDAVGLQTVIARLLVAPHVDGLVKRLDQRLALVPHRLARVLRQLLIEPGTTLDLDALVADAYMTRRSVDRWLHRAGLAPPKRFLGAARLLRAHLALADGEMSLGRAASRAGFSSERSLALHARTLLGVPPSALRALPTDEMQERVARCLQTA